MSKHMKVLFVGDSRSGKTACFNKLMKLPSVPYAPTKGVNVTTYLTKSGVELEIWDCGGAEVGFRDGYYIDADICVLFGENKFDWARDVQRVSPNVVLKSFRSAPSLAAFFHGITFVG